jgi:hypothetical protein
MNRYATVAIFAFLIALPRIAYAERPRATRSLLRPLHDRFVA